GVRISVGFLVTAAIALGFLALAGNPEFWFPTLAAPWLLRWILASRGRAALASFDELTRTRATALRFLALWPALTILCVSALPIFALAGLTLFHAFLSPLSP